MKTVSDKTVIDLHVSIRTKMIGWGISFYYSKVMFYVVIYQLYLNCIVLIVLVLISFSHGYSAILAAKLMIKLDLTSA